MKNPSGSSRPFRGFVHVGADHARSRTTPRIPRDVCELPFAHLELTPYQHTEIRKKYEDNHTFAQSYDPNSTQDQVHAASILASSRLDLDARESLENKWNVRWSVAGANNTRRVLYQCACGCSPEVRKSKKRYTPVDFTGCLAHGEITYDAKSHRILFIRGFFEHNEACCAAHFKRAPCMPVHPEVYQYALTQLRAGTSLAAVKEANGAMYLSKKYPSMQSLDPTKSRFRYILEKSDIRSLYRQLHNLRGIKIGQQDHINLDEWLDPTSSQYNKVLHEAIFHYSARAAKDERLEVCIATPAMKDAAWKYAHQSQIILDGTFGICNKKMLLFIVMGVDEANRGVPLAFFLFSAPRDNKRTCAGYDTDVLERMLDQWKKTMGTRNGEVFDVWVAITDTDLMERGALLRVFSKIWLLICRFHLRQSWKNHRNTCLKGSTDTHMDLKGRLKRLEDALVETEAYRDVITLLNQERTTLTALRASELTSDSNQNTDLAVVDGALEHVKYLEEYWARESLWQSWSRFGRLAAAALIKRSVNEVLPTTNHLESFNGVLKRTYLAQWQKGGRRLRLDVLINVLVMKVLPSVFLRHQLEDITTRRRQALISSLPGGSHLLHAFPNATSHSTSLAYLAPDDARDRAAAALVTSNQISVPSVDDTGRTFTFTCYSSLALAAESAPATYQVVLDVEGSGACTCKDFTTRGGACKHMRAALVRLVLLREHGMRIPLFGLPASLEEAYAIRAKRLADTITAATVPLQSSESPALSESIRVAAEAVEDLLEAGGASEDESEDGDREALTPSAIVTDRSNVARSTTAEGSTISELNSSQGLNDQTLARALYELEHTTPKLRQLGKWLQSTHLGPGNVAELQRIETAKTDLDVLIGQLDRLILSSQRLDHSPAAVLEAPERPRTPSSQLPKATSKRRAVDIIGPSPEKRATKRHDSHAPH